MKNKIRFILPRLIALTVIVGLASLIMGAIFKLLLVATILFGIGSFAMSKMRRREMRSFKMDKAPDHPGMYSASRTNSAIVPLHKQQRVKNATIVPVY
ncbi:hypothetical protein BWD42_12680 [Sphingobacterium sp. CZ-UAM]|uniref:hypothetical protein n=1 Tax=Sphingobacterium sp. CZ-UAM TaxID=1933868 RepID=UPI0009869790|nr:hypothetical protein [Sphingobacterium sp. CZ-UAM]OOG18124.1 hypothetical protein BWD42_12680 [Sphingobacterium sp. CZ-UAM]